MAVNKASPIPPWASVKIEPKRQFKFILTIGDIPAWVVTRCDRPNPNFDGTVNHEFLGHQFKFPGKLKWSDVNVTLVEPIDPDVSGQVLDAVIKAGYNPPSTWTADNEGWRTTFSKERFVTGNFGNISIKVLDSDGNEVETWTLFNSFVSDVNYSALEYSGNNINTVTLKFSYDYATVNITEINQN